MKIIRTAFARQRLLDVMQQMDDDELFITVQFAEAIKADDIDEAKRIHRRAKRGKGHQTTKR